MAKAVKLADIAERVGVSTVTVSKALSGQKGVSEEVREKIRSIAEELGYQQPSAARKSQNQKSYNIGILISERFLDKYESFYWQMYQAVATRACLLYTSDAADDTPCVDIGGRRIIKKIF